MTSARTGDLWAGTLCGAGRMSCLTTPIAIDMPLPARISTSATSFIDTFRYFNPDLEGAYSWWSYRFNARANNAGWRIDYFLVTKDFEERLKKAEILSHIMGSDHCPVLLEVE